MELDVVYANCCGIDVHKKLLVACRISQGKKGKETRTFSTKTQGILELADWLREEKCTHVAMESTGVYWRPIYNLLDGDFTLLVVNAQHIKAVPGRKTDVKDAEWIANLLHHGLLTGSYIPSAPQRELRELTRYRTSLIEERTRVVNRLQKTLEDTNLKLGDVVSDIMGKSSRTILEAMLAGETDPATLVALAKGRLRAKPEEIEAALVGRLLPHHRFMLTEQLHLYDTLQMSIGRVEQEIEARFEQLDTSQPDSSDPEPLFQEENPSFPNQQGSSDFWCQAVELLDTIPGINAKAAHSILAEIGVNMARFPSAGHLASWAGVCPGHNESAGKRFSGKTRKGSPWLRKILVEVAQAAAHTKNTYLSSLYHRLKSRRGGKKALVAVAHAILKIIYYLLSRQVPYQDLGPNYFDEREHQAVERRLVHRLEHLGYQVSLSPVP